MKAIELFLYKIQNDVVLSRLLFETNIIDSKRGYVSLHFYFNTNEECCHHQNQKALSGWIILNVLSRSK